MNYEEELQKNIEKGLPAKGDASDIVAYQAILRAMKNQKAPSLSPDFSDKIVARIVAKERKSERKEMVWFVMGIAMIVISFIAIVLYTGFKPDFGFLKNISRYSGVLIFGAVFVFALHLVDKFLIRQRQIE